MDMWKLSDGKLNRSRQRFIVVSVVGLIYWLSGIITWQYPPDYYLNEGRFWGAVFVTAGWSAWMTLVHPRRWLATISGAALVSSALFRGSAILIELGWSRFWGALFTDDQESVASSFAIGGMTWLLVAILVWIGWPQVQAGIIGSRERNEQ